MAAEFLLTFATEGILLKVSLLASQELTLAWGFKAELKKLGKSLSIIQDFLHGAADQKAQNQVEAVEEWVKNLKDIAHDADEVLEEFNYEVLRRKVELQNHMKRKVLNFLSASNPLLFRLKMAHKINKINDSLVELKNQAALIKLVAKRRDSRPGGERPDREQTDSFFEQDEMVVGRDDVVSEIVESLTNSNNQRDLSVMAIVGMPGLGKTTVAKSVYNEPAIDTHFHQKIWVCVSSTFDVDDILSQMLESLKRHNAGMKNRNALIESLQKELTEKKYVLILDDVWSEDRSKWLSLMYCLSKLNSTWGSSIIITTRSANVASIAETLPRPELRNLSNEECWSILKQRALNLEVNDIIGVYRERIGRRIAEKCGGVPLVAKVLGSIMRTKTSRDEWLSIQESEIWKLPGGEGRVMSVLKLSFDNLKSLHLKQCFAYFSMLRKDFEIERDNLIQLWMAQGLLQPSTGEIHQEPEDIGNEYFNILLKNSLIQEVTEGDTTTKYTMHNLVHDLAEEVSKSESSARDLNDTCEVRHAASIPPTLENMSEVTVGRLHSLFLNDQVPDIIFSKFRALCVLNLHQANIEELSDSVGKLKRLRYLDVSYTRIKALPQSIRKLYNLQTLKMEHCRNLERFPKEVQDLINLRHIYFDLVQHKKHICLGWYREFPIETGQLTNLRTIPYFIAGKSSKTGRGIEKLAALNQLRGQLTIYDLENVRDGVEAKKANLVGKREMLKLTLVWGKERSPSNNNEEDVLEGLQPHSQLQILEIHNFMGAKFPSWIEPLGNLTKIQLLGCKHVPVLGHLRHLRHLEIDKMNNLEHMEAHFYGHNHVCDEATTSSQETKVLFPELKTLRISKTPHLIEWMEAPVMPTGNIVVFPCLQELVLFECPQLRKVPSHFPSLRQLEISVCHELSSLPSVLEKCTTLEKLVIRSCDFLVSLSTHGLTSLRKLEISSCSGLKTMDLHSGAVSHNPLKELSIKWCRRLEFPIDHDMASLRELKIWNCDRLSSIRPLDHCTSLQVLQIRGCENLTSSGMENCTSLQQLMISHCSSLETISFTRVLPSLRKLSVSECPKLASISFSTDLNPCHCLEELLIKDCNGLQSLPDFRSFTSLRVLEIARCAGIESLVCGIHIPVFLEELRISGFHNIPSLEECRSLRQLGIWDCERLEVSVNSGIPIRSFLGGA